MPHANSRVSNLEVQLTRAQRKVLADLELFSGESQRVVISSRRLAQYTGLSRPTVLSALAALNDRQLIQTHTPRAPKTSEHILLFRGSVRMADGQICPSARRASTGGAR